MPWKAANISTVVVFLPSALDWVLSCLSVTAALSCPHFMSTRCTCVTIRINNQSWRICAKTAVNKNCLHKSDRVRWNHFFLFFVTPLNQSLSVKPRRLICTQYARWKLVVNPSMFSGTAEAFGLGDSEHQFVFCRCPELTQVKRWDVKCMPHFFCTRLKQQRSMTDRYTFTCCVCFLSTIRTPCLDSIISAQKLREYLQLHARVS